jgi:S1-C subfamily serine protease
MNGFALHTVIGGLLRRTWIVALVTVIVCAAFAAHAVAALVEASYLPPPARGASPQKPPEQAPAKVRVRPDGSGFVARNIFCSTCDPVVATPGSASPSPTGLAATLIATSVGDDSRATVRVPSTEVQGSWGLGETIPGVGIVDRIGWVSIDVIDAAGGKRKLSLLDSAAGPVVGAATPATAPAANAWADRIRKLDEHTFDVDRDLVKELVTGATKPGAARILPLVENGDVKGVKFYGVNASSLPFALGLKSGDILSAVDGEPIKSAQQMLDLYAKVDKVTTVEFGGTRGGKPMSLTLNLK